MLHPDPGLMDGFGTSATDFGYGCLCEQVTGYNNFDRVAQPNLIEIAVILLDLPD